MRFFTLTLALLAVTLLVACASRQASTMPMAGETFGAHPGAMLVEGTITKVSSNHGNAYTSIGPAQYAPLGLVAGGKVRVIFGETAMVLVLGEDYSAVPPGQALAVLHREGLTLAIRDGNFSRKYQIKVGDQFRLSPAGGL